MNKPRDHLDIFYILDMGFDLEKAVEIAKQELKADNDKFDAQRIYSNKERN